MNPQPTPQDSTPELEALVNLQMSGNEKLGEIDSNTEGSLLKLDEISGNTEANIVATNNLKDPLERIVENTKVRPQTTIYVGERTIDENDEQFNENAAGKALWSMLRGPKGQTGEQGEKGDKGDKGETGADSVVPGPKGDQGEQGVPGPKGEEGRPGKDGKNGKDGKDGLNGKDGKDGRDGKDADQLPVEKIQKQLSTEIERVYQKVGSKTYSANEIQGLAEFVAENAGAGSGVVQTIVAGTGITVDSTDPANPIVTATGGGGGGSGITRSVSSISTPTTAGATALTDYIYFITNTTLTLPTAVSNTNRYTVKCISGTCVVDGAGAETIDGTATITIQVEDSVDLISNNTEFKVV